jgi:transposase
MEHTTIAVDLTKSVFQVAVSRKPGRVDAERRLSRDRFLAYFVQQPPATVLLEACGSAHHWARQLQQQGYTVRLLPAHDVHRYVRRNKTDRTDAKALLEADRNDDIHAVPVKTIEHQAIAPASAALNVAGHAHGALEYRPRAAPRIRSRHPRRRGARRPPGARMARSLDDRARPDPHEPRECL